MPRNENVRSVQDHFVMAQNFIACDREQAFLMPPDVREWLPEGHLAWFVIDAAAEIMSQRPPRRVRGSREFGADDPTCRHAVGGHGSRDLLGPRQRRLWWRRDALVSSSGRCGAIENRDGVA
jgi:hypothetical protein